MTNETHSAPKRPLGDTLEGVGFQFCKVATVALLAGRYVLPVAAGLCVAFYLWAFAAGKKDSRCVLRHPLLIAGFWSLVLAVWIYLAVNTTMLGTRALLAR